MNSIKYDHSELAGNYSGVNMKFWGISCVGGKAYKQVVNSRFHLTMAVLDPKSFIRDASCDRTVTLSLIQHGRIFVLCVLKHDKIQQVSLNLIFDKGDDVTFIVDGYGTVHLTGYQLMDSSDSALDTDNEHCCPVAELGSGKMMHKGLKSSMNGVQTKKNEKGKGMSIKAILGGDDDDDEDDSDFSIKEEVVEEEEESDSEYEDSDDIEIDEEEVNDVLQEVAEMETPPKSEKCQKRKIGNMNQSQKRFKKENSEFEEDDDDDDDDDNDDGGNDDDVQAVKNKSDSDEGLMDSSIGNTPMPEQLDSAKTKKKSKKRKRLSEISNLGIKSDMNDDQSPKNKSTPKQKKGDNLPTDAITPKKKGENKIKHPVIKLEGGVEVQDVIVGRGPIAANGKIISVFYMGRLENHKIFDSRIAPKKPFSFKLGVPEVIKGLDIGIKGMRVGGQRRLRVPPNMGYGSKKMANVPPNSTLFFTVELQSVN